MIARKKKISSSIQSFEKYEEKWRVNFSEFMSINTSTFTYLLKQKKTLLANGIFQLTRIFSSEKYWCQMIDFISKIPHIVKKLIYLLFHANFSCQHFWKENGKIPCLSFKNCVSFYILHFTIIKSRWSGFTMNIYACFSYVQMSYRFVTTKCKRSNASSVPKKFFSLVSFVPGEKRPEWKIQMKFSGRKMRRGTKL